MFAKRTRKIWSTQRNYGAESQCGRIKTDDGGGLMRTVVMEEVISLFISFMIEYGTVHNDN